MISVIIEWNTDESGIWVDAKDRLPIPGEKDLDYPLSVVGPFEDAEAANRWLTDALEGNTDVLDMYSLEREFPEGWFIAKPEEFPDGYFRLGGPDETTPFSLVFEPSMPIQRPAMRRSA